jgi:predicted SAM-dependent methyltransferase
MCHPSCIEFVMRNLSREEIEGKKVIEIGSYNVNGSVQQYIKSFNPKMYLGVDITEGPNVDIICNAENLVEKFGKESFDIVISNEMLELELLNFIFYNQKHII